MLKVIIPLAALALLYTKNKVEQLLEGLSFEPAGIKFSKNGLGLVATRFIIELKIFNKSNLPVPVGSISGKAFNYTDTKNPVLISNFNVQQNFTIPGNNFVVIPLEVTAYNLDTFAALFQIFKTGKTPKILVQGAAYNGPAKAPFELYYSQVQIFKK